MWSKWTPLLLVKPRSFVTENEYWRYFDIEEWSEEDYEYVEDPYGGIGDYAKEPYKTEVDGGDCEDYAVLVASWALSNGLDAELALCFKWWSPVPKHAVCRADSNVYSTGDIYSDVTINEYIEESEYDWYLSRTLEADDE